MSILQSMTNKMIPEQYKQMSTEELENRIEEVKARLGRSLIYSGTSLSKGRSYQIC